MARYKDYDWNVCRNADGTYSIDLIKVNLLMDIRDELKRLNALLNCPHFTGIPTTLRSIRRALPSRKKS